MEILKEAPDYWYAQEKISMVDFSTELFDGISSFTDYENEAHERLLERLSIDCSPMPMVVMVK